MFTKIRQWFLQMSGKTIIPLLERSLGVTRTVSSVLGYVLSEIISGKLEIPDNTVITDTLNSVLSAVKAITSAIESALEFMGVEVTPVEIVATSQTAVDELKKSTNDLVSFIESLKK